MKFSKEHFKKLAGSLLFELEEEEYDILAGELKKIDRQAKVFDQINIEGIEPMTFPYIGEGKLREDEGKNLLSQEEALQNAKAKIDGYIKVEKVVK